MYNNKKGACGAILMILAIVINIIDLIVNCALGILDFSNIIFKELSLDQLEEYGKIPFFYKVEYFIIIFFCRLYFLFVFIIKWTRHSINIISII